MLIEFIEICKTTIGLAHKGDKIEWAAIPFKWRNELHLVCSCLASITIWRYGVALNWFIWDYEFCPIISVCFDLIYDLVWLLDCMYTFDCKLIFMGHPKEGLILVDYLSKN